MVTGPGHTLSTNHESWLISVCAYVYSQMPHCSPISLLIMNLQFSTRVGFQSRLEEGRNVMGVGVGGGA